MGNKLSCEFDCDDGIERPSSMPLEYKIARPTKKEPKSFFDSDKGPL